MKGDWLQQQFYISQGFEEQTLDLTGGAPDQKCCHRDYNSTMAGLLLLCPVIALLLQHVWTVVTCCNYYTKKFVTLFIPATLQRCCVIMTVVDIMIDMSYVIYHDFK